MNRRAVETVEPAVVALTNAEADMLSRIVERRVAASGGRADAARAFTVREIICAGLRVVARAEGIT